MGKLRPKLSKALKRELDVRRQLNIRDEYKARGRLGAARAAAELARRRRVERRRKTGWDDLCFELQDMVLRHLSIADLANVRLAGLGATSVVARERLREHMLRRCAALRPLWLIWAKGTPKYQTQDARRSCMPVEFATAVSRLCVAPDAGGVPQSISEMRALKFLDVSRAHSNAFLGLPPPLTRLPDSLARCQGLLELRLSHHNFETLPECVLRLRNLRRLEVEYNVRLRDIPYDIGHRLSKLMFLNLRGCRKIKSLPVSLLERLERAVSGRQRHRAPLLLTARYFQDDYLAKTLVEERYPKLNEYLKSGSLIGPDIMWAPFDHFADGGEN